jgi:hypothetical protein
MVVNGTSKVRKSISNNMVKSCSYSSTGYVNCRTTRNEHYPNQRLMYQLYNDMKAVEGVLAKEQRQELDYLIAAAFGYEGS